MDRLDRIQQGFSVVLVLFAVGMVFGVDRHIQTTPVDNLPALQRLTFLKETLAVQRQLEHTLP